MKRIKNTDATGVERGAVGYGKPSKADLEFLKTFDRKADRRMYGPPAVGMYPKVKND